MGVALFRRMIGRMGILVVLVMGFVGAACGGDDDGGSGGQSAAGSKCEQACQKLESCSPGTTCQINGDCTGANEKIADCIIAKDCNQTSSCFLP